MKEFELTLGHYSFVLDAKVSRSLNLKTDAIIIRQMMSVLLQRLHMKKLGPLILLPATDLNFPGFSFIQPITTSHIAGHYFNNLDKITPSHIHIDIYSCKNFDWREALLFINRFLPLAKWSANYITRNYDNNRHCYQLSGKGPYTECIDILCPKKLHADQRSLMGAGVLHLN